MARSRWISRVKWLVLGVLCLTCCVLLPCSQKVRRDEGWARSAASMRSIGVALQSYHEVYGELPPAVVRDKNGQPLYSWRVALLPFLEEHNIYQEFKLDEPWDSEH